MQTLTYGTIPENLTIAEPYAMRLNARDELTVVEIVNQGIDSHLEAVFVNDRGVSMNHHCIDIQDSESMRCFLRRCVESDDNDIIDFAGAIMSTLDYEWV